MLAIGDKKVKTNQYLFRLLHYFCKRSSIIKSFWKSRNLFTKRFLVAEGPLAGWA